jgi:hypothetical protein
MMRKPDGTSNFIDVIVWHRVCNKTPQRPVRDNISVAPRQGGNKFHIERMMRKSNGMPLILPMQLYDTASLI